MLGRPSESAKWLSESAKWLISGVMFCSLASVAVAQDTTKKEPPADDPFAVPAPEKPAVEGKAEEIPGLKRLTAPKEAGLWIDAKNKLVVFDGEVVIREGLLEMFACPKGTKEHESVVVTGVKPSFVNGALIALGIKHGHGAKFDPKYEPATGPIIDIFVLWKDSDGKEHRARAQDWIKSLKTEKAMEFDWVYSGSGEWKDEDTGEKHFHADGGDFICVSNFPTAMLDLPVPSSQSNDSLSFTAFTENIPPKGTKVRLVLKPRETKPEGPPEK